MRESRIGPRDLVEVVVVMQQHCLMSDGRGGTATVPVQFNATGSALKHTREASVALSLPSARQWLSEKTGYAVLTPVSGTEPVLRVALYAAPKPVSDMHAGPLVATATPGQYNTTLSGTPASTEDAAHEANETAAQEAAEDSGQGFHGGRPNEDPAHEAAESADREAAEDNGTAQYGPGSGAPVAPGSSTTPSN